MLGHFFTANQGPPATKYVINNAFDDLIFIKQRELSSYQQLSSQNIEKELPPVVFARSSHQGMVLKILICAWTCELTSSRY